MVERGGHMEGGHMELKDKEAVDRVGWDLNPNSLSVTQSPHPSSGNDESLVTQGLLLSPNLPFL